MPEPLHHVFPSQELRSTFVLSLLQVMMAEQFVACPIVALVAAKTAGTLRPTLDLSFLRQSYRHCGRGAVPDLGRHWWLNLVAPLGG